jgi:hypothetical protein
MLLSALRALRVRALSTGKASGKKPAAPGGDKAKGEAKPAGDKKRTPRRSRGARRLPGSRGSTDPRSLCCPLARSLGRPRGPLAADGKLGSALIGSGRLPFSLDVHVDDVRLGRLAQRPHPRRSERAAAEVEPGRRRLLRRASRGARHTRARGRRPVACSRLPPTRAE